MSKTISACIIAKDEAKCLERCLESLENVVDEIIFIDTGSSDNTVEIAKRFTTKIYFEKWENDFSKVRNKSLEYATKDYILYIDCDEYLVGDEWESLKNKLDDKFEGYCVLLTNIINKKEGLESQSFRIFKNRKNYRFKGKIHEQVIDAVLQEYKENTIGFIPLQIYHSGYDGNECNIIEKQKRNFKIYESYTDKEKDGFFYYNLGCEYLRAKDNKNAIKYYLLSVDTEAFDNGYRKYLAIYLTKALIEEKRFKDAKKISSKFLKEYPDFPDLHFLRGSIFYNVGKYTEALEDMSYYYDNKETLNYPNFKLDTLSNSTKILSELTNRAIEFNKSLISIIVNYENLSKIKNNIYKLNEFCENIILYSKNEKILKEGEQCFCKTFKTEEEVLKGIEKSLYTFYFRDSEFIDFPWFLKAVEVINTNKSDLILSIALDKEENIYETVRVAKTEIVLKEKLCVFEVGYKSEYKMAREKLIILNN